MKKRLILSILVCASCSTLMAVENAEIFFQLKDGKTDSRTVQLEKLDENTSRLTIKAADISENVKSFDILADKATAKKGDEGFWLLNRGILGNFNKDKGSYYIHRKYVYLPYYAMKTPAETFIAVIDGMRFEFNVNVTVENGVYKIFPHWYISDIGFKPYEDINITYYKLPKDADYNDMAKAYRKHKFARNKKIQPIKERMKHKPYLEQLAKSFPLRKTHASKPFDRKTDSIDFTPHSEHKPKVFSSFENTKSLLLKMKEMGMDDLAICIAGWQTGGYDGRCPASFPVCEALGGEAGLKNLIKTGQDLGYIMDGHSNFTDCFTCSPMWSSNIVCKTPEGKLISNGAWSGGKAYNLCMKNAWESFLPSELKKIADLGFRGAHYIDVFTAVAPYCCCDLKHAANRKQQGEFQRQAAAMCNSLFGGFASECGFDHIIDQVDYINYVCRPMLTKRKRPDIPNSRMTDAFVPFWELVYHDVVLSNPDKITQGKLSVEDNLRLVEFGGRPIFYGFSDSNLKDIKESYDQFMKLRYLQLEEMISHRKIADNVFLTSYADGSETVVNYSDAPFDYKSVSVVARDFRLFKP